MTNQINEIELEANRVFQKIKDDNKYILRIAIGVLITALSFGFYLWLDYICFRKIFYSLADHTVSSLGTALAGTSGILIGASTIIFLVYNVIIQNESLKLSITEMKSSIVEMQTSNSNFNDQKLENGFYNLLDNHNKLVNNYGNEKLEKIYSEFKSNLRQYNNSIESKYFANHTITRGNPSCLFESYPIVKHLTKNVLHVLEYIKDKLGDNNFNKETLYHSLNENVKYFCTLVSENKLTTNEIELPTDFIEEYKTNTPYYNIDVSGYVPEITFTKVTYATNHLENENINQVNLNLLTAFKVTCEKPKNRECTLLAIDGFMRIGNDRDPLPTIGVRQKFNSLGVSEITIHFMDDYYEALHRILEIQTFVDSQHRIYFDLDLLFTYPIKFGNQLETFRINRKFELMHSVNHSESSRRIYYNEQT